VHGEIGRDPTAERFAADHRLVPTKGLEDCEDMVGVVLYLVVDRRLVGPTMSKHVDGDEPEMIGVRSEVSGICLGVTADAVQREDKRLGRVARFDTSSPDPAGVNVVLLEHEQTAQRVLGESKEDALATIVLLTFSLAFRLHKERLTGLHWWKTDEASLIDAMKQERVRLYWERYKHEYEPKFVQYIDGLLQEVDRQNQSTS